jgi:general secretion pathway protein G
MDTDKCRLKTHGLSAFICANRRLKLVSSRSRSRDRVSVLSRGGVLGFTFIELMVVMAIIVVLITMAIPVYQKSIIRAKESVLKNNLFTIRTVIDNYTYDKQKAPQSLQDLVSEGYLREIPVDPMLASSQGWKVIMEDATQAVNQDSPGIFDVRSGSEKIGLDGTPYADW